LNRSQSAVRIRHLPTGITVDFAESRGVLENKAGAYRLLKEKLEHLKRGKHARQQSKIRGAAITSGDRSPNFVELTSSLSKYL